MQGGSQHHSSMLSRVQEADLWRTTRQSPCFAMLQHDVLLCRGLWSRITGTAWCPAPSACMNFDAEGLQITAWAGALEVVARLLNLRALCVGQAQASHGGLLVAVQLGDLRLSLPGRIILHAHKWHGTHACEGFCLEGGPGVI